MIGDGFDEWREPQPPRSPEERVFGDPTSAEGQARVEAEKKEQEIAAGERDWMLATMKSEFGASFIRRFMTEMGTFAAPYAENSRSTDFLQGQRAAGWRIWEQFDEVDPVLASKMRRGK